MAEAFDPMCAVRFDLGKGVVLASGDERLVVLPAASLDTLASTAPREVVVLIGKSIGDAVGQRVAHRLGGTEKVRGTAAETVEAQLGGELAVAGFGQTTFERWGRAMLVAVERPVLRHDFFVAAVLAGALEAVGGRPLACEPLARESGTLRLLVAREGTAKRARGWLATGVAWGDVIARLQRPTGDGA